MGCCVENRLESGTESVSSIQDRMTAARIRGLWGCEKLLEAGCWTRAPKSPGPLRLRDGGQQGHGGGASEGAAVVGWREHGTPPSMPQASCVLGRSPLDDTQAHSQSRRCVCVCVCVHAFVHVRSFRLELSQRECMKNELHCCRDQLSRLGLKNGCCET